MNFLRVRDSPVIRTHNKKETIIQMSPYLPSSQCRLLETLAVLLSNPVH